MRELRITLPDEVAAAIEREVANGGFADASAVVENSLRESLRMAFAADEWRALPDDRVERWLRDEVVPGHREHLDAPFTGVPAADLLRWVKMRRAAVKPE